MPKKIYMKHDDVRRRVEKLADVLSRNVHEGEREYPEIHRVYPIPRGGVAVAYALAEFMVVDIVDTPEQATVFVDDIIDSGRTASRYAAEYPGVPFHAIVDKKTEPGLGWVVFPWEVTESDGIEDAFVRLLQYIGEDPERGGLLETPARMANAWKEWTVGYAQNPADILKAFEDGGERYNEMVILRDIVFYSNCEHHLAPFFGKVHIAYVPDGKVVGLSKLPRLVEVFARRLQVQERMTVQIAEALMEHLQPKGVAVRVEARHLCVESRGVHKQDSLTLTTALRGVFEQALPRDEFLRSIGG